MNPGHRPRRPTTISPPSLHRRYDRPSKGVPLTHSNLSQAGSSQMASVSAGDHRGRRHCRCRTRSGCWSPRSATSREPGISVLQALVRSGGLLALAAASTGSSAWRVVPVDAAHAARQPLEDVDLSSLRSSSPAPPRSRRTREQWERRVPSCQILEGYGCTETGAVISVNPPGASRPGTVGRPMPGYQVAIRDDDEPTCRPASRRRDLVRADGVMAGYWNSPAETAATLAAAGCTPATSAGSTPTATCTCWTGRRTSSSAAGTTSSRASGGRAARAPGGRDGRRRRPAGRAAAAKRSWRSCRCGPAARPPRRKSSSSPAGGSRRPSTRARSHRRAIRSPGSAS